MQAALIVWLFASVILATTDRAERGPMDSPPKPPPISP